MNIRYITYHLLSKDQQGKATVYLNPNIITPNETHQKFLNELTKVYSGYVGKGFGSFDNNENLYPLPCLLRTYETNDDFSSLTREMMEILRQKIDNQPLATGGKVFFSHYEDGNDSYMLTAILSDRTGFTADSSSWQVVENEVLDIEHLKYAGLINLTAWEGGNTRYISFIKGKGDISQYFKQFLSCNDVLIEKEETKKLISLLNEFVKEQGYDFEKKTELFHDAHSYLQDIRNRQEPFSVDAFANRIYPSDPVILKNKLSNTNTGVADGFIPDKSAIRGLVVFIGKTSNWRLSFDREAINKGDICTDNGKIVINNPPEELLDAFS